MATELKATVINMKSLSQNIPDPVVVGAGDVSGRTLRIIFTQEAEAQFTPETKVYLSWYHQQKNIKGYNVFTEITNEDDEDFPPTWEIHYPKSMLYEGDVLACIQIVDGVSIATSTNFMIHILINPNDGSSYTESDDYSDFQKAVISLTNVLDRAHKQMTDQKIEFEDMQLEFMRVRATADEALAKIESFETLAQEVLEKTNDIDDIKTQMAEIQEIQEEIIDINTDKVQAMIDSSVEEALAKHDEDLQFFEFGFDDGGD